MVNNIISSKRKGNKDFLKNSNFTNYGLINYFNYENVALSLSSFVVNIADDSQRLVNDN